MKKYLLAVLLSGAFGLSASAFDIYNIPDTSSPMIQFHVYYPGESVKIDGKFMSSTFNIPQKYVTPILLSAQNWLDAVGISSAPVPAALYSFLSNDDYNAMAGSPSVTVLELPYKITRTNAVLHGYTITSPASELELFGCDGAVIIGRGLSETYPGWEPYAGKHALYHGELPELYAVMNHEMMHSLGLTSSVEKYHEDSGDEGFYFSYDSTDPLSIYDSQLRVYEGNSAPTSLSELMSNETATEAGQKIGKNSGEFNIIEHAPYFVGENTIKVLGDDDDYDTARENIINNGGIVNYSDAYSDDDDPASSNYPTVYGLPIHPNDFGNGYDLSHVELRNSYMSHQDYRNWLVPMEAELALMNDLGYNVDLRKYFGKSYYLNEVNNTYTAGFSEWDGTGYTGYPSTIDQAVGIHIYGNDNNIIQAVKSIETMGEGSIGVRIDGIRNTFTLESGGIHTNGKENIGIAVTWGSGHVVNVNGAEVTATGEDGIAASFDFGSNLFGTAESDIKGSFINNSYGFDNSPNEENQSALVSEFNVNSTLTGSKAAIYISDNAYVENININDGAKINGDIISEWNSISSLGKAAVQTYDATTDEWRAVDADKPNELYYTNLNFDSSGGTGDGIDINGDIIGDSEIFNTLKMDNKQYSKINFNGSKIDVNSLNNDGEINIVNDTTISTFDNTITGAGDINVTSAALNLSTIQSIDNALNLNNVSLDVANNSIGAIELSGMELTGQNSMAFDIDLNSMTSDTLVFNDSSDLTVNSGASLELSKVNLMNANQLFTKKDYYIPFISSDNNNQNLLGNVSFSAEQKILTPIFKYSLGYSENDMQAGFLFSRGATKNYGSYNPAVVISPVAAQFGGYLNQLNSYEQAFQNLDMKMLMTRKERQALKYANLYASAETPKVFSPTYLPEKDAGAWFRPYASFEKADLRNGPKVENISYGSYFGGDSPMYETKNGWDYQYSLYAGYNGSHQNYSGNSIYQNGGTLGATVIWYKDDFFTALTANVGASVAEASTMYGSEDFPMLMTGVASKTGYNWELSQGKFIIQPSFLMSYSFINTFDYTNSAGIRIKSDPLNAINIAPGLKFIGNLKNGWQPYIGMQMVWNIMDKTDFKANDVALPDMSVKPYFQYGVGVQKRWGDRFTGFFQTMIRNGGRNGVALSLGFRWALGKDK